MRRIFSQAVRVMAFAVGVAAMLPIVAQAQVPPLAAALPAGAPVAGFASVAEKLLPQVVNISTTQKIATASPEDQLGDLFEGMPLMPGTPFEEFFREFRNQQQQQQQQRRGGNGGGNSGRGGRNAQPENSQKVTSLGSGFIVDASGYVVTNNHVIKDADEINVVLQDDTTLKAKLVGYDQKTDLALLKVTANKPLPAISWGDSDKMRVGDWVLAIGNPYGLGGTVTAGIISARARDIQSGPYDDFLQTDAAINRGNSGGPMFNMQGEVIGVNTAIYSPSGGSVGIGFAIPSAMVKTIVNQLKTNGHTSRGWLGVKIQSVSPEIATSVGLEKPIGAMISSATPGGPAEAAGVKNGDVVLSFDGKEIGEMRRLPRIVAETEVGKTVPMVVWRNGKAMTVQVKLGELEAHEKSTEKAEAPNDRAVTPTTNNQTKLDDYGLVLGSLTPENRRKYNIKPEIKGVLVAGVKSGSKAAERGLQAGDVIMEIAQQEVSAVGDVVQAAKAARDKNKPLLMLVNRDGDARFVALSSNSAATKPDANPAAPQDELQ